ncbi:M15 family metallopeptidase [Clostridium sp.]|uniref:M15 family metallopeptidase n=1 Tax=Clostridium sp. TaxID=1506 RepID=UPI001A52CB7C|nr:M15 family metallopeptidase [Clostridium sp.]MBK5242726.1 M15 family metallopeptidase [Clostridium sp.]
MKKILALIVVISLFCNFQNPRTATASNVTFTYQDTDIYNLTVKRDLLCLMIAYPEFITNIEENNGYVYLVLKSGNKLIYDDKAEKNFDQKLANPDLQDTLEQIYPLTPIKSIMDSNFDPGRARCYSLLSEMYGSTKQALESNLTGVKIGYKKYQFNKNSSAASSLQSVMNELIPLSEKNENVRRCFLPCSGTFNYRVISGTSRLSPHAYGIAIDLASDKRDYWKWASKSQGGERLASYPSELVQVFEKNGFVWGGKWSHFDILHFEYRPEIILKARYFSGIVDLNKPWYEGAALDEPNTQIILDKINKSIK